MKIICPIFLIVLIACNGNQSTSSASTAKADSIKSDTSTSAVNNSALGQKDSVSSTEKSPVCRITLFNDAWDNIKIWVKTGPQSMPEQRPNYENGFYNLPKNGTLEVRSAYSVAYRREAQPGAGSNPTVWEASWKDETCFSGENKTVKIR